MIRGTLAALVMPWRAARRLRQQEEAVRALVHVVAALADGHEAAPVRQRHLHLVK